LTTKEVRPEAETKITPTHRPAMYDIYKPATIEITFHILGEMFTKKAIEMGIIDEHYFMEVIDLKVDDSNETLTTNVDIFKYLEN